jgi:UDP-N-acetylglucosamine 2-epimerase (non-hydrolysing)
MTNNQSLTEVTSRVQVGMAAYLEQTRPDLVFVQGDTTTAFTAALAAFYLHIPVCHIEAGLRTGRMDQPFPEEMNRRQIGSLAAHHFPPTANSRDNLLKESIPAENIFVTGNTAIDALQLALKMPVVKNTPSLFKPGHRGILVTAHRRENFGEGMDNICRAIATISAEHSDVHVVFPVHYNPQVRSSVNSLLKDVERVTLIDPLDYGQFVRAMGDAHLVITDSGGVQEEAPSLGKPVLVLRECTERPEAVMAGTVAIVGTNTEIIVGKATELLNDDEAYQRMARVTNPYGDGQATARILGYLARRLSLDIPGALDQEFLP